MCGIAGWLSTTGNAPDRGVVAAMTRTLARRGPDVEGIVVDGPVAFGHRRLSVLDLSAASNQPMWDHTGRYLLVFNGEIYNFRALRRELEQLGHAFTSQGDSEVLLEAFRAWGPAALDRVIGMFAFALWDKERRSLLLARDRLGKKPMFFARLPKGGIAFASEPRALAVHPDVTGGIDRTALAQYLQLNYVPCHRSLYAGVESLPPACYAEFDAARGLRVTRYWDLARHFHAKRAYRSEQEAADELRELIDDAVRLRMVSDVPLGAFLSGGVDSSTIAASMVRHTQPVERVHVLVGLRRGLVRRVRGRREDRAATRGRAPHPDARSARDRSPARSARGRRRAARGHVGAADVLPFGLHAPSTSRSRSPATVATSASAATRRTSPTGCIACWRCCRAGVRAGLAAIAPRVLPVDHRKVGWAEKLRRFSAALAYEPSRAHASWRDIFRRERAGDGHARRLASGTSSAAGTTACGPTTSRRISARSRAVTRSTRPPTST